MAIRDDMYWRHLAAMPKNQYTGPLNAFNQSYDLSRQRQAQDAAAQRQKVMDLRSYEAQQIRNAMNQQTLAANEQAMTNQNALRTTLSELSTPSQGNFQRLDQMAVPDKRVMDIQRLAPFMNSPKEYLAATDPQRTMAKSTPDTDTDDFVRDAMLARAGDQDAKARNEYRLQIKRAQWQEQGRNRQAVQDVNLATEPGIASAVEGAKLGQQLKFKPAINRAVKLAEKEATERGDVLTDYARATAAMPGLRDSIGQLKDLAVIASSTMGERAFDAVVRESGFGATKGANARAKFIAIVDNQVLPLLKPTFGAAFTVMEGDALRATMGDPNLAPSEKMAQLEAFIDQKERDIQTKERQLSQKITPESQLKQQPPTQKTLPQGVTEEDITETMRANNMTREQVMQRLGVNNGR